MKKAMALFLSTIMLMVLAAGCSATNSEPAASPAPQEEPASVADTGSEADTGTSADSGSKDFMKGTLRIVGPGFTDLDDVVDPVSGETKLGYRYLQDLFHETYPDMTLEIEAAPWDNWMAKLQTSAATGEVDVLVHGGSIVDAVMTMDDFLEADPELKELLYVKGTYRRPDPENYTQLSCTAIPIGLNPYVLMFDKKLYDDFGVEYPNGDDTWETLLEKFEQTTGVNPNTGEQCYGTSIRMDMTNLWRPFLSYNMQNGISAFKQADAKFESEILIDTPEVIGTLDFMERLSNTFAPGFLEMKGFETFGTEENNVGVYLDRMVLDNWRTNKGTDTLDRYGYAPYPKRADGQGRAFFLGDWNMAIPKNCPQPEAAWEFIRWMVTDERVVDYIISTGNIPNSKSGMSSLMSSGVPFADAVDETFKDFPEFFWAASSEYYDNSFGPVESVFGAHITSLYSGQITAEQAAQNIQKELEEFAASN